MKVIVPNVTFVSPINSVIHNNAKPVLCDIDEKSFTLNISSLKKLITTKTKATMCPYLWSSL